MAGASRSCMESPFGSQQSSSRSPEGDFDPSGKKGGRSLPPWGLFKMWSPSLVTAAPQRWEGSQAKTFSQKELIPHWGWDWDSECHFWNAILWRPWH